MRSMILCMISCASFLGGGHAVAAPCPRSSGTCVVGARSLPSLRGGHEGRSWIIITRPMSGGALLGEFRGVVRLRGGMEEGGGDAGEEDSDSVVFLGSSERVDEEWSGEEKEPEMDMQMVAERPEHSNAGSECSDDEDEDEDDDGALRNLNDDSVAIFAHNQPVYSVCFSPFDEDLVATGGGDDRVRLWRMSSRSEVHVLDKFDDTVCSVGFSNDGTYVAAGSMDGSVKCWLASTGEDVATMYGPSDAVLWMEWHPRGAVLLAGSDDGYACMWEVTHEKGKYESQCLQVLAGHSAAVSCGGFAAGGRLIVTGCDDAKVRIYSPKDGKLLHCMYDETHFHGSPLTALGCHPSDPIAVSGDKQGACHVINVQQGKVTCSLGGVTDRAHGGSVESICFSKAMLGCVATGSMDGTMRVWDVNTGVERVRCTHKSGEGVTRVVCLQRKPMVLTGTTEGRVCVWDATGGTLLKVFGGHRDIILDLAINRDENVVLTGGDDKTARLFSLLPKSG